VKVVTSSCTIIARSKELHLLASFRWATSIMITLYQHEKVEQGRVAVSLCDIEATLPTSSKAGDSSQMFKHARILDAQGSSFFFANQTSQPLTPLAATRLDTRRHANEANILHFARKSGH
jgi:hypothetical protein